jgi:hypothetical protein
MSQQLTLTAETQVEIRPLIESAVQSELKMLELSLQRTRQRLRDFEQRFGMSSANFEQRFDAGELEETLDLIEWLGEIKTLDLLRANLQALQGVRIN